MGLQGIEDVDADAAGEDSGDHGVPDGRDLEPVGDRVVTIFLISATGR